MTRKIKHMPYFHVEKTQKFNGKRLDPKTLFLPQLLNTHTEENLKPRRRGFGF